MWGRLLLLIWFLGVAVYALVFGVWGAAVAGFCLALFLLAQVIVAGRAALRGEPQPEPRLHLPVRLSRAQQFAAGMVLLGIPLTVWRVIEDGLVALAVIGPLAAFGVAWLAMVMHREGWSGDRLSRG